MIPPIIFRTVPADTTDEVERWWRHAFEMNPGYEWITYRDPLEPADFPITAPHWELCKSGAQFAGLIRLEALLKHGGLYLDSDVEIFRTLDPLFHCTAFAGWEDPYVVPDAVIGAEPDHRAIKACLDLALERLNGSSTDWRTGPGAWGTGPGVTTTILPHDPDVLLLPPASFYPVHYTDKHLTREHQPQPFTFGIHHWNGSWV